jgi:arginyl-tRNA synthetase
MIQATLIRMLDEAVRAAAPNLGLDSRSLPTPEISRPRAREHGDWATNVALVLAKQAGRPPREVAQVVADQLDVTGVITRVEVAGPGFVNLFLHHSWLHQALEEILERGPEFGRTESSGERVQVEFVSANPTGPLHIGHARNAALGDALANLLEATGAKIEREYYWNDTGTQIDNFGGSVEARYLQMFGRDASIPEGGYQGAYIAELAEAIAADVGDRYVDADPDERRRFFVDEGRRRMFEAIHRTLERFRVHFDTYRKEAELVERGEVEEAVRRLRGAGYAYDHEGAVWFRATDFSDDKDRVLVRSTGEPTYFAKDCAYVLDKAERGFDRMVYVWGADHHGDTKRLLGAAQALGIDPSRVQIVLYQFVSLYRSGQPVKMSKRSGDVITLDELLDEVGTDAARFTLLSRSPDSPIDFDIDAVTRQSLDNPVYYVQYAHARIASILRVATEQEVQLKPWGEVSFDELVDEAEFDLLRRLAELPEVIEISAAALAPHRLTRYAEQVAADFHSFYTACRVISDDPALTQARLWLAVATKQVIAATLGLIGVSAPESMERLDADES